MKKLGFNDGWQFTSIDTMDHRKINREMTVWREVTVPHDWTTDYEFNKIHSSVHQGGYVQTGMGWYRKYFTVTKDMLALENILLFEGVYHQSTVFVNGEEVGGREYGYSEFTCDVTSYLKEGLNLIVVRVDCMKEPSSRWFNGAGITRNVWLLEGKQQYIPHHGSYIRSENITDEMAEVLVDVVTINKEKKKDAILQIDIKDMAGEILQSERKSVILEEGENNSHTKVEVENPNFWSCENPYLYQCVITIITEDGVDVLTEIFGIRNIAFKPQEGFFLNGKHTLFKGVCLHHDGGCVGAAVPEGLWRKRLLMLKEMGCNAVRTSHNPFDPVFYTICDEIGLMVIDEAFDGWDVPKVQHDYSNLWEACHKKDLHDFIIRDRNHPSIVLWSVGNEVLKMRPELTKELMEQVRALDDTRKITAGVNDISETSDQNRAVLDIAGYNDGGGACFIYENDHEKRPNQLMIASEAPHTQHTRGFYRTQTWWRDKNQPRIEIENLTEEELFFDQNIFYNSSYDNSGVRTCTRDSWEFVEQYPYLCGEFRWTGFDYIGEASPESWPARTQNFGVIDMANFEKDHYYLYQSMWSKEKMVHLLPHWTHPYMKPETKVPVWVYTNCEEAELFLNGASLGKKEKGSLKNLEWIVPYEAGKLEVKGYEDGQVVATKSHTTATTPTDVLVTGEVFPAQGKEKVAQWTFQMVDENKNFVPYANNITGLYLSPACQLIGSDNGAIDDMSFWKSAKRRAFNGLGMYMVRYQEEIENIYGVLGFIAGDSYFDKETTITLGVKEIDVNGTRDNCCEIYYTMDGSTPSKNRYLSAINRKEGGEVYRYQCNDAIVIKETTYINMVVYLGDQAIITLGDLFVKGRQEPVIDLTHLNYSVLSDKPVGPFSDKIVGDWENSGVIYRMKEDGRILRVVGMQETQLGYWWYDFPRDFLETPNYAGTGEFWISSGEVCAIALKDQTGNELLMDNSSKAIAAVYASEDQLIFKRI